MNQIKNSFLLVFVLSAVQLIAQLPKGYYIESSVHFGKSIKHRSIIQLDFPSYAWGSELNLEVQTYGNKKWHQSSNFPRWGLALVYLHSGNEAEMGSVIGFLPNINIDFFKKNRFRIFGRFGTGLGLITKPYHPVHNSGNDMVGSYLNNITALRLGLSIPLSRHLEIRPSASITHLSNGASAMPNRGINIPTFQLSICYMYNPVALADKIIDKEAVFKFAWKFRYSALFSMGIKEQSAYGTGIKHPVYNASLDAGIMLSSNNLFKLGIEFDYIGSYAAFMNHLGTYKDVDIHWQSSRFAAFLMDEIFIGRFSLNFGLGFYLTQHLNQPLFTYFRLAAKYYLSDPIENKLAPFLYISIKAHTFVAEYFSIGIGLNIQ